MSYVIRCIAIESVCRPATGYCDGVNRATKIRNEHGTESRPWSARWRHNWSHNLQNDWSRGFHCNFAKKLIETDRLLLSSSWTIHKAENGWRDLSAVSSHALSRQFPITTKHLDTQHVSVSIRLAASGDSELSINLAGMVGTQGCNHIRSCWEFISPLAKL